MALQLQLVLHQQSATRTNSKLISVALRSTLMAPLPVHRGVGNGFQLLQAAHTSGRIHVFFFVEGVLRTLTHVLGNLSQCLAKDTTAC
jgi:hypothetical protein